MDAHSQDQFQISDNNLTYQEHDSRGYQAIEYVKSVRDAFGKNGEEYLHFIAILHDFKANRITTPVVISRIKLLFSEHQELIEGFNLFLPETLTIALPLTMRGAISIEGIISYFNKVKVAFSKEKERHISFLQLIAGYRETEMRLQVLSEQMCELLSDRQDLLEEFFDCMPLRKEALQHAAINSAIKDGQMRASQK